MKKILIFLIVVTLGSGVKADEGMWLLPLLKQLNMGKMKEMGMKLTAEEIYSINNSSLKDAVVIFGGGCTGEIVSDQGLLFTNHHCGYGQIQSHSTVENNYLEEGFWAGSFEEELPNPDLTVTFLKRIEDVTGKVLEGVGDDLSEEERMQLILSNSQKIEEEAVEGTHYEASVRSFFNGNEYYMMIYEIYKDVRLVGTPPSSIGKFGADTDNWMWPRHTGDFSIFRVYSGPDGKPAEYSNDNIPLKPKHFLPISLKGVEKGDFAFVMGFPGSTDRYLTSHGIEELLEVTHPNRIKIRGLRQDILLEDMMASEKVNIQYATKYSRSSNYWKYSIGQSEGLRELKVYAKKEGIEEDFSRWLNADPERKEKYGEALTLIQESYESRRPYQHATQYLGESLLMSAEIIRFASEANGLQRLLADEADDEKINEEINSLRKTAGEFYKNYNPPTDKKVVLAMLQLYGEDVPSEFHPEIYSTIENKFKGDYARFVDKLFEKSVFASEEAFQEFLEDPSVKTLEKDLAFLASGSVINKYREIYYLSSQYNTQLQKGERLFLAGLREMNEDKIYYPDANFSMRLTYGSVGDYSPRDAVHYDYLTTIEGIMEKEDPDNWEFVVPEKLKELYETKDYGRYQDGNTLPVCFITNNDITGGNSGSPVLNGNGELIGLAFDGNWEAMSGDIAFEPELQKCICVDIRYVLFIIDKYAGATHLIDELVIVE